MGTGKLIGKNNKLATSPCDEIYILGHAGYQYFPIASLSRTTLKPLVKKEGPMAGALFPGILPVKHSQLYVQNSQLVTLTKDAESPTGADAWAYSAMYVKDIGLNQSNLIYSSHSAQADTSLLSDGNLVFGFNEGVGWDNYNTHLIIYSPAGAVIASATLSNFLSRSFRVQSESGKVRIYVYVTRVHPADHEDLQYDAVVCYTFNGLSLAYDWLWTDDSDPMTAPGRLARILTPRIGRATEDTCYLVSVIIDDLNLETVARVSVIQSGVRLSTVDVPLNEYDEGLIGDPYNTDGLLSEAGVGLNHLDFPECAVHFDGTDHLLYIRPSAGDYKPTTLHRVNLTQNCSVTNLTAVSFADGKPKVLGISADRYRPEEFDTILQYNKTRAVLTTLAQPDTIIAEVSNEEVYHYKQEVLSFPTFTAARINRFVGIL